MRQTDVHPPPPPAPSRPAARTLAAADRARRLTIAADVELAGFVRLSIRRRIVAAHGGKLWAENHPAGGATFHVVLPTVEPEPHADATASTYRAVGFPDPARGATAPA